jgi:hypothetical protein
MASRSALGSFLLFGLDPDIEKPCALQISRRTAARVSAKVGCCLRYQAAVETAKRARLVRRVPSNVTMENSASRQGVVRAIA